MIIRISETNEIKKLDCRINGCDYAADMLCLHAPDEYLSICDARTVADKEQCINGVMTSDQYDYWDWFLSEIELEKIKEENSDDSTEEELW